MPLRDDASVETLRGGHSTPGVVRVGAMIYRPPSSNALLVHELLRHLEHVGFAGAPRFRGIDPHGRERLTYVHGTVPHNVGNVRWTDDQLRQVARLLRTFHDATTGTPLVGQHEVVCHNDAAPWNTVLVDNEPAALIDFDEAAPGSRVRDVSYAVWCWLNLGDERFPPAEQARRMRLFCDAYGLANRDNLLTEIAARQQEIHDKHVSNGHHDRAATVVKEHAWLQHHAVELAVR